MVWGVYIRDSVSLFEEKTRGMLREIERESKRERERERERKVQVEDTPEGTHVVIPRCSKDMVQQRHSAAKT